MAVFDTPRAHGAGLSIVDRLSHLFANANASVLAWNRSRRTRAALSKLTERELEDIGLTRGDIADL